MQEGIRFLSYLHRIQRRKLHLSQQRNHLIPTKGNCSPTSKEGGPTTSTSSSRGSSKTNVGNEEIQLNIYVLAMVGKMNMTVLVTEMCKIPSVRREVLKFLKVPNEEEDPLVILNTMYHGRQRDTNPPFYISLGVNGLCLNNCMLDFRASKM
jgi:hypothetical protein